MIWMVSWNCFSLFYIIVNGRTHLPLLLDSLHEALCQILCDVLNVHEHKQWDDHLLLESLIVKEVPYVVVGPGHDPSESPLPLVSPHQGTYVLLHSYR